MGSTDDPSVLARQSSREGVWLERAQFAFAGAAGVEVSEHHWVGLAVFFALSMVCVIAKAIIDG